MTSATHSSRKLKNRNNVINITVAATGQSSVTGSVLMAKASEAFWHDLDGNLLSDSLWTNRWSAENRLMQVESTTAIAEEFFYGSHGAIGGDPDFIDPDANVTLEQNYFASAAADAWMRMHATFHHLQAINLAGLVR